MRLVFPFIIVTVSGGIDPASAIRLAMERGPVEEPGTFAYILNDAHPSIAAFGGVFLLMLFLNFIFDTERESTWLSWLEKPLQVAGRLDQLATVVVGAVLLVAASALVDGDVSRQVLVAGLAGLVTYLAVTGLSTMMEAREEAKSEQLEEAAAQRGGAIVLAGKAALSLFFFLEVLDASFSFDGVIGAFAITQDPIIIAIGLGVGALFVRSMTIYLVRRGTLAEYRFLEHGAHWAIGTLAVMLILTLRFEIPDYVIGLVGMVFILTAWWSSARANGRDEAEADRDEAVAADEQALI
jgi:hypothetical protein